ncbi:MAG: hypothetical protein IJZ72_02090 [Oscillospiraceae bacterium]|nr:hypothetical protein [Oscillospiraceae bacterium]
MSKRKYPAFLFVTGIITNFLFHFFYLFVPAFILLIIGIWVKVCGYIALALLVLELLLSVIEQLRIRKAFLSDSPDSAFRELQEVFDKDGDWRENMKEIADSKIRENNNQDT